jgi:hypothetical protein
LSLMTTLAEFLEAAFAAKGRKASMKVKPRTLFVMFYLLDLLPLFDRLKKHSPN